MNVEFTFLESVSGALLAEIVRALLESRGIRVMLSQESAGAVFGLSVGPIAQVDILVPQSQYDKAMEVLEQYYAGELDVE